MRFIPSQMSYLVLLSRDQDFDMLVFVVDELFKTLCDDIVNEYPAGDHIPDILELS